MTTDRRQHVINSLYLIYFVFNNLKDFAKYSGCSVQIPIFLQFIVGLGLEYNQHKSLITDKINGNRWIAGKKYNF